MVNDDPTQRLIGELHAQIASLKMLHSSRPIADLQDQDGIQLGGQTQVLKLHLEEVVKSVKLSSDRLTVNLDSGRCLCAPMEWNDTKATASSTASVTAVRLSAVRAVSRPRVLRVFNILRFVAAAVGLLYLAMALIARIFAALVTDAPILATWTTAAGRAHVMQTTLWLSALGYYIIVVAGSVPRWTAWSRTFVAEDHMLLDALAALTLCSAEVPLPVDTLWETCRLVSGFILLFCTVALPLLRGDYTLHRVCRLRHHVRTDTVSQNPAPVEFSGLDLEAPLLPSAPDSPRSSRMD